MARGTQTVGIMVLVVEDEMLIRLNAESVLEAAGFVVLSTTSAAAAINILQGRDDVSVLFSDIAMPGDFDGNRLAEVVRAEWPPIGIVLTSGQFRGLPIGMTDRARFLPKPYLDTDMITAIRSVLPS